MITANKICNQIYVVLFSVLIFQSASPSTRPLTQKNKRSSSPIGRWTTTRGAQLEAWEWAAALFPLLSFSLVCILSHREVRRMSASHDCVVFAGGLFKIQGQNFKSRNRSRAADSPRPSGFTAKSLETSPALHMSFIFITCRLANTFIQSVSLQCYIHTPWAQLQGATQG